MSEQAKGMTVDRFHGVVWHLANGGWCRYWLDWDLKQFSVMAFQVRDESGKPSRVNDAARHGFTETPNFIYTINRLNEDGTPYRSEL